MKLPPPPPAPEAPKPKPLTKTQRRYAAPEQPTPTDPEYAAASRLPYDAPAASPPVEVREVDLGPYGTDAIQLQSASIDAEGVARPVPRPSATKRTYLNAFTSVEVADQVHQCVEWISLGLRPNQIRRLCREHWDLNTRTAESRIAQARKQMIADANVMDRAEKVGQMLQQLEQVLQDSIKMKQGSNAIGALRLQADLLQLIAKG